MRRPDLPAGELGDVGVLLLRHDRGAGRPGVVEDGPAELARGPQADLLAEARQVHPDHRCDEQELGHEVAIAHRVDGVGDRAGEAELERDGLGIELERRAGQRPGAQRRQRRPDVPVGQPVEIAAECVGVLGQLVAERHRLGVLQVREAGRGTVDVRLGLVGEREHEVDQRGGDRTGLVTQVEPQVGGHLVVAAAPGAQLAADGAEQLEEPALDGGVDVLVVRGRHEGACGHLGRQRVEGRHDLGELGVIEQPGPVQDAGVSPRLQQVVRRQAPVEVHREAQRRHLRGGSAGEPAAPQPGRSPRAGPRPSGRLRHSTLRPTRRSRAAAIFEGRPQSSMKPLASDWSNVSPVS